MPEPHEIDPADWIEVEDVISHQLEARGLPTDIEGIHTVLRLDWQLIVRAPKRRQAILHRKHGRLDKGIVDSDAAATRMRAKKSGLPPDPGFPT